MTKDPPHSVDRRAFVSGRLAGRARKVCLPPRARCTARAQPQPVKILLLADALAKSPRVIALADQAETAATMIATLHLKSSKVRSRQ